MNTHHSYVGVYKVLVSCIITVNLKDGRHKSHDNQMLYNQKKRPLLSGGWSAWKVNEQILVWRVAVVKHVLHVVLVYTP